MTVLFDPNLNWADAGKNSAHAMRMKNPYS